MNESPPPLLRPVLHCLCLLSGLLLTGCPSEPPRADATPVGKWYWTEPATGATYYIYVPKRYTHKQPAPVIVSCHGTVPFDVANSHIETWKWYGEDHGFIIVCPELVGTDGILGDGPVASMLEDERRILSILSTLSYRYNIDRNNIFLTGFSGGGFPAYFVGLRNPDVFRAIAPRNANFNRNNTEGWWPAQARSLPFFVIWGENDPGTIKDQSQRGVQYLRSKGFKIQSRILPGIGHERKPQYTMKFFLDHLREPRGTMNGASPIPNPQADPQPTYTPTYTPTPSGPRPPNRSNLPPAP